MTTGAGQKVATPESAVVSRSRTKGDDTRFLLGFVVVSFVVIAALVVGVLAFAGERGGSSAPASLGAPAPSVAVTLKDFAVTPTVSTASAGLIDFAVSDAGPQPHEFIVFRTDLAQDKLPLGADGNIDEEADGITNAFDSGDNIPVGTTLTFHTALTAGQYVVVCNLPGHYKAGMHTAFTVTESASAPVPVKASLSDFAVTVPVAKAQAGLVDFTIDNKGPSSHEFVVFATDLPADKLPVGADGNVDEGGEGITNVLDSGDNIDVGGSRTIHGALAAGNYVIVCNLPGHYKAGMHTSFQVTSADGTTPPTTAAPEPKAPDTTAAAAPTTAAHAATATTVASASSDASAAGAPVTAVTLKDFSVTPSSATAAAGLIDFAVTDKGPQAHELVIFRTDLAPDKLPLGKDGNIDEEGDGIKNAFDSGDNIPVDSTLTFHAALTAGSYVIVCNLPGHYKAGMHAVFTVTESSAKPAVAAATLSDFAVTLPSSTVKGGLVDFTIDNKGPSSHEFVVFATDLAADKLPLGADGNVDEGGEGIANALDSGDNIDVGGSRTIHGALVPGNYVIVCNLPGHYKAGMHTTLTVTA